MMNRITTSEAERPGRRPRFSSRVASGPSISPSTMPRLAGARMYSPAWSMKIVVATPITITATWALRSRRSSTFDLGGSRTIGAFLIGGLSIGAFLAI